MLAADSLVPTVPYLCVVLAEASPVAQVDFVLGGTGLRLQRFLKEARLKHPALALLLDAPGAYTHKHTP